MTPPSDGRVDRLAQAIAARVVTMVVEAIDFDAILGRINIAEVVRQVDVEEIVDRIDIDAIAQRVDVQRIAERLDLEAIIRRVDVNAIVEDIDIDGLISRTELGSIIMRSTSGLLTELVDLIRSQVVGLDDFVLRWTSRAVGRAHGDHPVGPPP